MSDKDFYTKLNANTSIRRQGGTLYLTRMDESSKETSIVPIGRVTKVVRDFSTKLFTIEFTERHAKQQFVSKYDNAESAAQAYEAIVEA